MGQGVSRRVLAALAAAAVGAALLTAGGAAADDGVRWLCRPGLADDPCRGGLATTDVANGGTVAGAPAGDKKIDCFYVYPTVSQELTPNASLKTTPQLVGIAEHQAARFSDVCDVYAPVYRQRTLTALLAGGLYSDAQRAAFTRIAYSDVLQAWKTYLSVHNKGRGVVLIGHSQGTGMLRRLMREEVDPDPSARAKLVSAILLGGNVVVRKGSDRGGDFQNIPLCRAENQTGCVLAWAAFGKTPPDNARFGRAPESSTDGSPAGPDYEAACTNPTSLGVDRPGTASTVLRSEPLVGLLGIAAKITYGGAPPSAATPWLIPADRYTVQCVHANGAHVLQVTPQGDARTLRASPTPDWGLHLLDVNIALGDLIRIVAAETAAYTS
ncbi:DUF3089 domain-containing protein [Actinocorallia libanotica]|uniref:DUF3089 domain-containing protein n=1 Tax=Actinocorallia libanotica TaxID=46162 RepID=A0ABP4CHV6_9ACTN